MAKLAGVFSLIVAVIIMLNPVIFGFALNSILSCIVIGLVILGGALIRFG
jgi:hypothetical protein